MGRTGGHARIVGSIALLLVGSAAIADESAREVILHDQADSPEGEFLTIEPLHRRPGAIDPVAFFKQVVQRYRTISAYADQTRLVEVTTPEGGTAQRRETSLQCEITPSGELKIHSPAEALLQDFGIQLSLFGSSNSSLAETSRAYDLWQAPHMTLRFLDDPLHDLRAGVRDGLHATRAQSVTVGKRKMVQIELEGDADQDAQTDTRVDLYVDPESMLVERVESREQLPDGAMYETTIEIEPRDVRDEHGKIISHPQRETEPLSHESETPQQWDEPPQSVAPVVPPNSSRDTEPPIEPTEEGAADTAGPTPSDEPAPTPTAPPTHRRNPG